MKQILGLENLHEINNGAARLVFDQQLAAVMRDCENRAMLIEKRSIPMQLVIVPTPDPVDGKTLIGIVVSLEVGNAKLPARKLVAERLRCQVTKDSDGVVTGTVAILNADPFQDNLLTEGAN